MRVSWYYTPQPEIEQDIRYREDNEHFVRLANLNHRDRGVSQDMEELIKEIKSEKKLESECKVGEVSEASNILISEKFGKISMKPLHEDLSEESLEIAAEIYFEFVFCPNHDVETVIFYKELIEQYHFKDIGKKSLGG